METTIFEGTRGVDLFARIWEPQAPARGVVVVVHGFKSHSGLYDRVAEDLLPLGLAVYALDLRGHGRSGGERWWVERFSDYVDDLELFVQRARARHPGVPIFLLGHSAGGVIACLYGLSHPKDIDGLVCESFAHEVPAPPVALMILKAVGRVLPHAHVLDLPDDAFSRDPAFVERMKRDPLVVHTRGPANTVAEMIRADELLRTEFPHITVPLLILHGTGDRATLASGSQRFYDTAGSRDKTLRLYEGHYHDLLNDVGHEQVMNDVTQWLDHHLAAAA